MSGSNGLPDLTLAHVKGQHQAEQLLLNLAATCPAGDDLYQLVKLHTLRIGAEQDTYLRGFLRVIQKRLENFS